MTGYREMLRDNVPAVWDLALRWCKCKGQWVELVYTTHIAKFNNDHRVLQRNTLKSNKVKMCTLKKRGEYGLYYTFADTINLSPDIFKGESDTYDYWVKVNNWVKWFAQKTMLIKDDVRSCKNKGNVPKELLRSYLMNKYSLTDKLVDFILDNINYETID